MRPSPQETADLVTCTEEIFIGKLHFFLQWFQMEDWREKLQTLSSLTRKPPKIQSSTLPIHCIVPVALIKTFSWNKFVIEKECGNCGKQELRYKNNRKNVREESLLLTIDVICTQPYIHILRYLLCGFNYLCIQRKWSPWDCITKLHDSWMFKALLRIKKSRKCIDFDLAKF